MPVSFPGSPQPNKTNKLGSARIAQGDTGKGSTKRPANGHGGKTSAKVGFRGLGLNCSEVDDQLQGLGTMRTGACKARVQGGGSKYPSSKEGFRCPKSLQIWSPRP